MLLGHWNSPTTIPEGSFGFIYRITEKSTGKYYIGCKQLYFKKTLPPLKGTKRKRKTVVESDWKVYCGSGTTSEIIKADESLYSFRILKFCDSKINLKIQEAKEIIDHIYDDFNINQMINLRVRIQK